MWCLGSGGEIWGKSPEALGFGVFCALRKSPEALGFGAFYGLRNGCVTLNLLVLRLCSTLFLWALEMSGMGLGEDRWHSSRGGVQFEPYMSAL